MKSVFKLTAISAVALTLVACGGGGGGGSVSNVTESNLLPAGSPSIPAGPSVPVGAQWDVITSTSGVAAGTTVKTANGIIATLGMADNPGGLKPIKPLWAHSDVTTARNEGWTGKGIQVGIIDNFTLSVDNSIAVGNLKKTHGEIVQSMATGITGVANAATAVRLDLGASTITQAQLNAIGQSRVINMSISDFNSNLHNNSARVEEFKSLLPSISNGSALVTKAAGNDSLEMGQGLTTQYPKAGGERVVGETFIGQSDLINTALRTAPGVVFVGALTGNGGTLASYSNKAGTDAEYQKRFLVVGIDESRNGGLPGTSFAAPIVAGYGAIIMQKFVNLNGAQTAELLLNTTKWNANFGAKNATNQAIYGQGEASLNQALAPSAKLR